MKKIVILSDTHSNLKAVNSVKPIAIESDYVLHAGDGVKDLSIFSDCNATVLGVDGNCDAGYLCITERVIEIESRRIFLTHGHLYGVKRNCDELIKRAKELNCDIAIYGHTHKAIIQEKDGLLIINPGSLSRLNIDKSICYLVIDNSKAVATLNKNIY